MKTQPGKRIKEFGEYPTVKGYSILLVEEYKGWQIRRMAGGPGQEVGQWLFVGTMNSRAMPGHDIETPTFPGVALVRRAIDVFQKSDYAESKA